jgi:hypothetical protein
MKASELEVGDRVLIEDASLHGRDWVFRPIPIIFKVIDIDTRTNGGFHAVFDEKDESKMKTSTQNWKSHTFWFHFEEIIKVVDKNMNFNPSSRDNKCQIQKQ